MDKAMELAALRPKSSQKMAITLSIQRFVARNAWDMRSNAILGHKMLTNTASGRIAIAGIEILENRKGSSQKMALSITIGEDRRSKRWNKAKHARLGQIKQTNTALGGMAMGSIHIIEMSAKHATYIKHLRRARGFAARHDAIDDRKVRTARCEHEEGKSSAS